jgi:cupin domain
MRTHLPKRHDRVPRLESAGCRFGQDRRVEHEVLRIDDRRAVALEQPRDVRAGEAAADNQRSSVGPALDHERPRIGGRAIPLARRRTRGRTPPRVAWPDVLLAEHVIEGELEITLDGETALARPGLVAIVPPNTPHSVRAVTDGTVIVVDYPLRETR